MSAEAQKIDAPWRQTFFLSYVFVSYSLSFFLSSFFLSLSLSLSPSSFKQALLSLGQLEG